MTSADAVDVRKAAGWLPGGQDGLESWLAGHAARVEARGPVELHPVLQEFKDTINADPVLRMYVQQMIDQVPDGKPYTKRHLHSVDQMLDLINEVLTMAPEFSQDDMVMTPIGAILDWTMGTRAGFAVYRDPRFNAGLQKVLSAWCDFLNDPDSLYVLNDSESGWMSDAAQQAIGGIEQFRHDPDDKHWGFTSWNDFFTRRFVDDARPVASPQDDSVIANACESTPYGITIDVQAEDRFWIKRQPYSLRDMLAGDEYVDDFVGGTVYQAFLSATNYHRWHSPVAGTIVRAFTVAGTYYSEPDSEGADAVQPTQSQSYLAHVAARAVVIIRADDPAIGLVAFVPVGMSDVSSCVIDPAMNEGHHVAKGDELGYFQFGGSTHCLVFGPGVIDSFSLAAIPQPHDPSAPLVPVRSELGRTRTSVLPVSR